MPKIIDEYLHQEMTCPILGTLVPTLHDFPLTTLQMRVLHYLKDHPGSSAHDVAKAFNHGQILMTGLVRRGLVVEVTGKSVRNRPRHSLYLTDAAKTYIELVA